MKKNPELILKGSDFTETVNRLLIDNCRFRTNESEDHITFQTKYVLTAELSVSKQKSLNLIISLTYSANFLSIVQKLPLRQIIILKHCLDI